MSTPCPSFLEESRQDLSLGILRPLAIPEILRQRSPAAAHETELDELRRLSLDVRGREGFHHRYGTATLGDNHRLTGFYLP